MIHSLALSHWMALDLFLDSSPFASFHFVLFVCVYRTADGMCACRRAHNVFVLKSWYEKNYSDCNAKKNYLATEYFQHRLCARKIIIKIIMISLSFSQLWEFNLDKIHIVLFLFFSSHFVSFCHFGSLSERNRHVNHMDLM